MSMFSVGGMLIRLMRWVKPQRAWSNKGEIIIRCDRLLSETVTGS